MKNLLEKIRKWFDWSDLLINPHDWTQEPYEGNWWKESMDELYSRND